MLTVPFPPTPPAYPFDPPEVVVGAAPDFAVYPNPPVALVVAGLAFPASALFPMLRFWFSLS